jgi:SAM-dependent methyltransferase
MMRGAKVASRLRTGTAESCRSVRAVEVREAATAGDSTAAGHRSPVPVPSDYGGNLDRMHLARSVLLRHAAAGGVHGFVARRFIAEGLSRALDIGCGKGELARFLPDGTWTGLDNSPTMLALAPAGGVVGDGSRLIRGALLFALRMG